MADYSDKNVLVVDNGLFVEFALTLAQSFGRVFYWSPWVSAMPKSNTTLIGYGMPGIERVQSIWDVADSVDLFVFPDIYFGPLQTYLVRQGKRVWGARMGEELELDRAGTKELCINLGIDIGPYDVVTGVAALRDYLRDNQDKFVKISALRGDCETFYSQNYRLIEPQLDQLEYNLGAKKGIMEFVVEAAIHDAVEIGFDGWTIDGNYPRSVMWGVEIKARCYVMETGPYRVMPSALRTVNDKLASPFAQYGYRGFFSSEVRATLDGDAYLIDPCARMGSPPGELFGLMVTNWPDIIWEGAEGTIIEPQFAGKYGALLRINSSWADKNWQPIDFPQALRDFIKLRNVAMIGGRYYVVPQAAGMTTIGSVVAVADTMSGAVDRARRYAEQVEGYTLETFGASLEDAVAEYQKAKALDG